MLLYYPISKFTFEKSMKTSRLLDILELLLLIIMTMNEEEVIMQADEEVVMITQCAGSLKRATRNLIYGNQSII